LSSGSKGKEIRGAYSLLSGLEQALTSVAIAEKLLLSENPQDYGFLKHSRTQIDGIDDSSEWQLLKVCQTIH
jgi:myosin heavy subunit